MGFWSFMRDMIVLDWLFGRRKKESFWEQSQRESGRYADNPCDNSRDSWSCGGYDYNGYHDYDQQDFVDYHDYGQQDFDDDLDSGVFDDDF